MTGHTMGTRSVCCSKREGFLHRLDRRARKAAAMRGLCEPISRNKMMAEWHVMARDTSNGNSLCGGLQDAGQGHKGQQAESLQRRGGPCWRAMLRGGCCNVLTGCEKGVLLQRGGVSSTWGRSPNTYGPSPLWLPHYWA